MVAGGTDLMVEMNSGRRRPDHLIALDRVPELRRLERGSDGRLFIGAGVPYVRLMSGPAAELLPALAQAARTVGSPQIRQTGTLGGNVGTCSPAGDGLPVVSALDGEVHLLSKVGRRVTPFNEFMVGPKRTTRNPREVILGVSLPVLDGWRGYSKVGVRNAMVISTASSCLAVDRAGKSISIALGSVGPVIIRCSEAEAWVSKRVEWDRSAVDESTVASFAAMCAEAARPIDDHRSTAAYRRHAVSVLASRQLRRAFPNV